MKVCDWCHGTKGDVEVFELKFKGTVVRKYELCGPCRTAYNRAIKTLSEHRQLLRPESFLKEV